MVQADAVRFVFVCEAVLSDVRWHARRGLPGAGHAMPGPHRLFQVIQPGALLCSPHDAGGYLANTLASELSRAPGAEQVDMHLSPGTLDTFLRRHADAILVDVREPFERLVGPAPHSAGREATQVPLSRLVNQVATWLHDPRRPLVFVCRSGNRSSQAAACMRRLGYGQAWHLVGGLALAGGAGQRGIGTTA